MALKNKGTFIIDKDISEKEREKIVEQVKESLSNLDVEVENRKTVIDKRKDFYEGRHSRWTNVKGLNASQQDGHIKAVFNYVFKFCRKLENALTNNAPQIKIKPTDESNEIETLRAEAVEEKIREILSDNKFFKVIFKRCANNQVRDGDFSLDCRVIKSNENNKKEIKITSSEDMTKLKVVWDDASGSSFSGIAYCDEWSLQKIMREFAYEAEPWGTGKAETTYSSHNDAYGMQIEQTSSNVEIPDGKGKTKKGLVEDYWGYHVINGKVKILNIIFINKECKQFIITDYKRVPKFVGHSFEVAGKPWSKSFIDDLIDPQVELNDRTSEEGDMVRIGANIKFLAINVADFDEKDITTGSGQVIFINGENSDFKPLIQSVNNIPTETYINRVVEHMFNIGLPKIALAAGTAPYTGRVAAIQYQPIIDIVTELRNAWEVVMEDLIKTIQEYMIEYFPEYSLIMTESLFDEDTGYTNGTKIIRKVEFDWDNILPLSRSDKVVDASTMRDRGAISLSTYLSEAGYKNPSEEIKKMKKESQDAELMGLLQKFNQFTPGAVKLQLDAQKVQQEAAAQGMDISAAQAASTGTPKSNAPILTPEQNGGERRGVSSTLGSSSGQTATPQGAIAQTSQNINAQNGV